MVDNEGAANKEAKNNGSPKSAAAASSSSSSGCFASGTLITLPNQKQIPIEQLQSGEELLTTDGSTIFTTQMVMMLDKNRLSQDIRIRDVRCDSQYICLSIMQQDDFKWQLDIMSRGTKRIRRGIAMDSRDNQHKLFFNAYITS
ncbi:unnamed protein product [Rotaria sp. Silwood1]|nr:unnamed protein product [Rotaria sp. Silwood1]